MKAPCEPAGTGTQGLRHGTDLETTAMQRKTNISLTHRAAAGAYRFAQDSGIVLLPLVIVATLLEVLL